MIPPEVVLEAYRMGLFPMSMEDGELGWFSPDPRGLIPLDDRFHVSRSLRKELRRGKLRVSFDTVFEDVMRGCAERESTWISEDIFETYTHLFHQGVGHCAEVWEEGELVGGLYGISIGGAFFGESMFSRVTNASKVALVTMVERLRDCGYVLFDTQWSTSHLKTFGCIDMPRDEYLELLVDAVEIEIDFDPSGG